MESGKSAPAPALVKRYSTQRWLGSTPNILWLTEPKTLQIVCFLLVTLKRLLY
jgi:hypothetical protein